MYLFALVSVGATAADDAAVRAHLARAEATLRGADVSGLDPARRARRSALLDALHAYHVRGVFPHNHAAPEGRAHPVEVIGGYPDRPGHAPVFVDEHGTHCAVATLLAEDGREDLVRATVRDGNLGYVHELVTPALAAWAEQAGFSIDELAVVQPAYAPEPPPRDGDNDGWYGELDCDDDNPRVHPGARERCDNGMDEDCDGHDEVVCDGACGGGGEGEGGVAVLLPAVWLLGRRRSDRGQAVPARTPGLVRWVA